MDARDLIVRKRDGAELGRRDLEALLGGYLRGEVPDYQMAAWLMAVFFRGMSEAETHELTELMANSGRVLDPSNFSGPSADKHSTGGVGDKISLALAPLVAAAGVRVPMLSGRGLGHTGGTLDKIESVPGLRTGLAVDEFVAQVNSVGCCIASQSEEMAPADGALYALRDVTGTVECVPLIVSSIVSKKVAEGAGALVFDVKWGRGAFMATEDEAVDLASRLVREVSGFGRKALAFVTGMNQPLGRAVGNEIELEECVEVLRGGGPADTEELTVTLGGAMLYLAERADGVREGRDELRRVVASGAALSKLGEMVSAQGGDPAFIENPAVLDRAPVRVTVRSESDGYVGSVDARELGSLVCELGGGRKKKGDEVDPSVGALLLKKEGEPVREGEGLIELRLRSPSSPALERRARALFHITAEPPEPRPLISWLVTADGRRRWED